MGSTFNCTFSGLTYTWQECPFSMKCNADGSADNFGCQIFVDAPTCQIYCPFNCVFSPGTSTVVTPGFYDNIVITDGFYCPTTSGEVSNIQTINSNICQLEVNGILY